MTLLDQPATSGESSLFKCRCIETLLSFWQYGGLAAQLTEIDENKKGRNLDFYIVPGQAVLRFPLENNQLYRDEIRFPALGNEIWSEIISQLSENTALFAYLSVQEEKKQWLIQALDELLNSVLERFKDQLPQRPVLVENEDEIPEPHARMAMTIYKTFKKIEADPLNLLTLLGKGTEEIMLEYREKRFKLICSSVADQIDTPILRRSKNNDPKTPQAPIIAAPASTKVSQSVREMKFLLKADELPGLILKRFDPIPVAGFEEALDRVTEEAYDKIARRAQITGLSFR